MSLPFRNLGRRRPMDERLPDGRTVNDSMAEKSSQDFPISRALSTLVRREPESPDRVMSGGIPSAPLPPRRDARPQPSSWQDRLPELISSRLDTGRSGLDASVIEDAVRGNTQSTAPLLRRRPQEDSASAPAGGLGTIRPPDLPTLKPRDVSLSSVPISDSLVRALERRDALPPDSKPLSEFSVAELGDFRDKAPYRDLSGNGRMVDPRQSQTSVDSIIAPALKPRGAVNGNDLPPRLVDSRLNAILGDHSVMQGITPPTSAVSRRPRVEDIGRPPEFGFDLKGKPVRAWRGDDLTTDLEYRQRLQDYKPKDRNGRLRSILYGIAWAISQGAQDGNPWKALGAAITGGLIGGIHPQFDEEHAREYELAATDARIDKGFKRRREQLDFERGVADRDKTLQEIQKMKDEPARLQREAQLKSTDEMRRVLAGFYNNLPEFDPEIDKDLASALREVGLPVTAKRAAQEIKVVQDEKSGAWHVVTVNKRTGESVARPVKKEDGVQLVTTPKSAIQSEQREANRTSREGIADRREARQDRRASQTGGGGLSPARSRELQLQAEKLDARAEAARSKGRSTDAEMYDKQAAAVRRQITGGQTSRQNGTGASGKYTADEVRARARAAGKDEKAAVDAARAKGILKE